MEVATDRRSDAADCEHKGGLTASCLSVAVWDAGCRGWSCMRVLPRRSLPLSAVDFPREFPSDFPSQLIVVGAA
jgi:hypothetical protein